MSVTELHDLLETADQMRTIDPQKAVRVALEAITLARSHKDLDAQTRAYYILGATFLSLDDLKKTITYAGLSIRFAKDYGCVQYLAASLLIRGTAAIRNFEIDKGTKDLIIALDELSRQTDFRTEGYLFRVVTGLFRGLKLFDASFLASELCLSSYEKLNDRLFPIVGHLTRFNSLTEHALAIRFKKPNKLDTVLELAEKSLSQIDFNLPNKVLLQEAFACTGDFFLAKGEHEKASDSYRTAIKLAQEHQMKVAKSFSGSRLALNLAESGEIGAATEQFRVALDWRKSGQDKFDDQEITETLYRCATLIHDPAAELLRNQLILNKKRREQGLESANVRLRVLEDLLERRHRETTQASA